MFHASLLTPYRTTAVHGPAYAEPPPELIDGEEEWEPEAILHHKKVRGGSLRYFVKWKEYPITDASWEPVTCFEHAQELLDVYKKWVGLLIKDNSTNDSDEPT